MTAHPIVYDLETYPNAFTLQAIHAITGQYWYYEVSDWQNDLPAIVDYLDLLMRTSGVRMVGFNILSFDYPILHLIIQSRGYAIDASTLYGKAQSIINDQNRGFSSVKPWEIVIPQVDLLKIHHFDNDSKRTSLKQLEFVMRAHSVEDLPFPVGVPLTREQMPALRSYGFHDIAQTLRFYYETLPMIDFRDELSARYGDDYTNFNDTKIGKHYFISRLEAAAPGTCYDYGPPRQPRQTVRDQIALRDVIFPYVQFQNPEFARIHQWMAAQVVDGQNPRGAFSEQNPPTCVINGFEFSFGVGGIHGSVSSRTFAADDEYCIFDIDVGGYYPSLAIANRVRPAHLGDLFCTIYSEIVSERKQHKKGTAPNAMLKLAGNGVYGDSGNPYSPFYDTQYMLTITVNGQLLLCMLAERILTVPTVELIQINTDGMTLRVKRDQLAAIRAHMDGWQQLTGLVLEDQFYGRMFVRDVNAYIAVNEAGKVKKRKGAFSWVHGPNLGDGELAWHQDHSALVVPMMAEQALLTGADVGDLIRQHRDPFDFLLFTKAGRGAHLQTADGQRQQNRLRYYVSTDGQPLQIIRPPKAGCRIGDFKRKNGISDAAFYAIEREIGGSSTWDARIHTANRSRYDMKTAAVEAGYVVQICNNMDAWQWRNVNFDYYISKARALIAAAGQ